MTQQEANKTVIWVLGGVSSVMLIMVAHFLVKVDTNIDALNHSVSAIRVNQAEMKSGMEYVKDELKELKENDKEQRNENQERRSTDPSNSTR